MQLAIADEIDLPEWADVENIAESIDENKPVEVNYRTVVEDAYPDY